MTESDADAAPASNNPGIRGTVLAVNQAYNFVVLSLGARQGVEANTEMLVLRGGSFGTDPAACRATFRNWDYPIRRQIFSGFRCARDPGPGEVT